MTTTHTAYTLGRVLALAEMVGDPLYRMSAERAIEQMKAIAAEYSAQQRLDRTISDLESAVDKVMP